MLRLIISILFVLVAVDSATAVPGDLNRDGKVDFEDFFILADNFGKTGSPESCGDTTFSTLDARRELGALNIQFNRESFIQAVGDGDLLAVSLFIDAGMDPNADYSLTKGEETYGPVLEWAIENNKIEMVRLLLDKGVSADAKVGNAWTALMLASVRGHTEIVRLLLEQGANVDKYVEYVNEYGFTYGYAALILAAEYGHKEVVGLLLDKGAEVDIKDERGKTALMNAVGAAGYESEDKIEGYVEVVRLLIGKGADVNAKDGEGRTVLTIAMENDAGEEIVQLLRGAGATE
jgi:ankyrin repeat protein